MSEPLITVHRGLATFGPEMVALRTRLEELYLAWAATCGARPMLFPPLMRVADLSGLDYFQNFPHLAQLASPLKTDRLDDYAEGTGAVTAVPGEDLAGSEYALPSAACYNIYFHLRGRTLEAPFHVTTVAQCFRNENEYTELTRLWGFSMREIVCVGTADAVQEHLGTFKGRVQDLTDALGLGLEIDVATDPFYQPQSSRAIMAKLFPQKQEFLYGGTDHPVAIASLNFHRNFFGERCAIRTADGEEAFSGCVAFGIERWLHALLDRFERDVPRALEALDGAMADAGLGQAAGRAAARATGAAAP